MKLRELGQPARGHPAPGAHQGPLQHWSPSWGMTKAADLPRAEYGKEIPKTQTQSSPPCSLNF